jgi:DNA-binding GntR family transcriptional regulator
MNTAVAKPISHKQLELPKYIELKYHLQKEILEKKRQAHDLLPTESELSNA